MWSSVSEDERRRIARELHDHVEQTFFAIGLTATSALQSTEDELEIAPRLAQALTRGKTNEGRDRQ